MKFSWSQKTFAWLLLALFSAISGGAQPVSSIVSGSGSWHSLFLKNDGSLWGMGYNPFGQLGDGTTNNVNRPEQIISNGVIAMAAAKHTLVLKSDGSLWAVGLNTSGQLGIGTYNSFTNPGLIRPQMIVAGHVTSLATGLSHSLFVKDDGSLWGMGSNGSGQLGDGSNNNTNQPEQILSSNVVAITAGGSHSMFIKSDGSLWAMGGNLYGQLGNGKFTGTNRPIQIVSSNVVAAAAGYQHSLFLKTDGSLWTMGYNNYGQLGDGNFITNIPFGTNQPEKIVSSNVVAIAAGYGHSLFLKNDGSVWGMGYGGMFGDGTDNNTNRPEMVLPGGVVAIAAGFESSLFLKSDGSFWAVGANEYGQLGDGSFAVSPSYGTNSPEQILAPFNQLFARPLSGGKMQLSFVGFASNSYVLERSFDLAVMNWLPLSTNPANSFGALTLTNIQVTNTNNFFRFRRVQ